LQDSERPLETLPTTTVSTYSLVPYVSSELITIKISRARGRQRDAWATAEDLLAEFEADESQD
jgi:hypothetical protein